MKLETKYLGLTLRNPLVASASPLSRDVDTMRRCEDAGCSAVVLFSLFEEQIVHESQSLQHYLDYGAESYAEALSYFPQAEEYKLGPDEYLELIRKAKASLDIPVVASLNGVSTGGWTDYARQMEQAGADALELNVYFMPTDPEVPGFEIERRYLEVVKAVKSSVKIPVAVKIGPYFSSMAHMVKQLSGAGADGVVMFNRFYEPDFDLDNLELKPNVVLSNSHEMRLPLHWIAILFGRVPIDFALSSGVSTHADVLKAMMAGANVACLTSEILRRGPKRFAEILEGLKAWMLEHEYDSIEQMRGSMSQQRVANPQAYERANYMKELQSFRADPAVLGLSL